VSFCRLALRGVLSIGLELAAAHGGQKLEATSAGVPADAYRKEALDLIIKEANCVAADLHLDEQLPITISNIVSWYVLPTTLQGRIPGVGNIASHKYTYYVTVGNKFSYLQRRFGDPAAQDLLALKRQYTWQIGQLDTNAAYQWATQYLAAASMDVRTLNNDCSTTIRVWTPEAIAPKTFVPLYWISWGKEGQLIAYIELLLPTRTLRQLRVEDSKYILRNAIVVKAKAADSLQQRLKH
jgi:hypothetical protein